MKSIKKIFLLSLCIIAVAACKDSKSQATEEPLETAEAEVNTTVKKPKPKIKYGYDLDDYILHQDTIKNGDSFGKILGRNGFTSQEIFYTVESVKDSFNTARIIAGKPYILIKPKDNPDKLSALIYQNDIVNYTVIDFQDSISVHQEKRPVTIKRKIISGSIHSSLSKSMDEAGASVALIHELSSLYQWKIDFFRLQKGDQFKMIYHEKYVDDSIYAGIKNIVAAQFVHHGSPYYAFHYDTEGKERSDKFYDEEAKTLQSFFLKAPVEYSRISSRYTQRRFHPVQKRYKSHLGTDYAAPSGTPIRSTADGVVTASSYTRFNGNYVKVRHNSKYTTQYLHMSRRKAKVGQRVKQGDVIGYVGQTGLATGPHVCYRFWVNGKQKDPYREKMPSSEPMEDHLKPDYFEYIAPLKEELDAIIVEEPKSEEQLAGF
ncbi:MAG TPA: peptidoglycan DD-metalloendopeptidase family protein [Flavobacteriaceae bacterium]|nr:peptidoglycan DD-metalloendopeptidase family protein [Flavobacteriaceae bacterium]